MLEKTTKVSVLRKMMGMNDNESGEPHYTVPQNSMTNMRSRLGLSEPQCPYTTVQPLENSFPRITQAGARRCPHCENMAKNFLYLESLIRANYNTKNQCSLCFSSLKYLEYVNKSILEVFGDFDSIVEAAKAFAGPNRQQIRVRKERSRHLVSNTPMTAGLSTGKTSGSKYRLPKKKSKISKLSPKASKNTASSAKMIRTSKFSLHGGVKNKHTHSKNQLKKGGKSGHSIRHGEGARKSKIQKSKSNAAVRNTQKTKVMKGKRAKSSLVRVRN